MNELLIIEKSFFLMVASFLVGAIGSLLWQKRDEVANWWGSGWAAVGSICAIIFGTTGLMAKQALGISIISLMPFFTISIRLDTLSALFTLLVGIIGFVSSIYGGGYMRKFYGAYNIGAFGFFYNIFLMSLLLVGTAWNAFYFLFVWELMSLASYFLVIFEHRKIENTRSGFLYLVMTHVATALILIAFVLLFNKTGSFDFDVWRTQGTTLSLGLKNLLFILTLIGFGTKAGIIPFHIWLPKAHPAAPSHVSALMSGVMIKTGILMIIRLWLDIFPGGPLWWGWLVLVIGAVSSVLGVLYALNEHDLKRLLAYHSVENIGIILLGVGSALTFNALGMKELALIGVIAALFHIINHAIFKALLFLGAGSVLLKTHTGNIEEYGGLIKRMPWTAIFFLIGAAAISALPPLNGFASEWATFQGLFAGINASLDIWTVSVFILGTASLAFTGGLAAACFVKAFGATFLARPRSKESMEAKESPFSLQMGMGILAVLCVVLGVFATKVMNVLAKAGQNLGVMESGAKTVAANMSNIQMEQIFIVLFVAVLISAGFTLFITSKRKVRIGRTWDCGSSLGPRMEITGTGFARSLIVMFRGILRPTKQTDVEYHDANLRYFGHKKITLALEDVYEKYLYAPLDTAMTSISHYIKKIQSGNINLYLLYIFITLIGLLIWATQ